MKYESHQNVAFKLSTARIIRHKRKVFTESNEMRKTQAYVYVCKILVHRVFEIPLVTCSVGQHGNAKVRVDQERLLRK